MENLDSLAVRQETKPYGSELVLDLHGCNTEKFNRPDIDATVAPFGRSFDCNSSTDASIRFHTACPPKSPASNIASARMAAWITVCTCPVNRPYK